MADRGRNNYCAFHLLHRWTLQTRPPSSHPRTCNRPSLCRLSVAFTVRFKSGRNSLPRHRCSDAGAKPNITTVPLSSVMPPRVESRCAEGALHTTVPQRPDGQSATRMIALLRSLIHSPRMSAPEDALLCMVSTSSAMIIVALRARSSA